MTVRLNITPPPRNNDTNVITRLRSLNSDSGTSGLSALRSTMRNAMPSSTAEHPAPITQGSNQPRGGPWVKTSTAAVHASVATSAPVISSLSRSWRVSSSRVSPIQTISTPMGRLIRKASRQEMTVSAPPRTRPSTDPMPCMAADIAIARLRAVPAA